MFPFLPKCQRNGSDLARQCHASQLRLHPSGQQTRITILEWSRTKSGAQGRTFEDLLHRMVVILIESANLLWFLRPLQLSVHVTVLRAVVCLYCQTDVGPQLPLAAEPVRGLHKCDHLRGTKRADERNLPQDFHCRMSAALG